MVTLKGFFEQLNKNIVEITVAKNASNIEFQSDNGKTNYGLMQMI